MSRILIHRYIAISMAAFLSALCGVTTASAAITNDWSGASGDSYTNSAAWSGGFVPVSTNTATVGNNSVNSGSLLYTNAVGDPAGSNALNSLLLGEFALNSGTFIMSNGVLSITNTGSTALIPGNGGQASGEFDMYGGILNVVRNASSFFQDSFQPGFGVGASGTFNLHGGSALFMCGIEIGINGTGAINVDGGTFIDTGWFGVARGGSASGIGSFTQSGGSVYLLRNIGTEGGLGGISLCQGGTNASVTLSGGSLYALIVRFAAGGSASRTDWENFTMSGGDFYLGGGGIANQNSAGTHNIAVNLSGGTFHTINMVTNNSGGLTLTNTILTGGTNWVWTNTIPVTLANSPGPGVVGFAADVTRTITLNGPFSGPGGVLAVGPGTVVLGAAESYTGGTTVSNGATLSITASQTNVLGLNLLSGTTLSIGNASLVENPLNMPSGTTLNFSASNQQQWTNDVTGPGNFTGTMGGNGIEFCSGKLNHTGTTIISSGLLVVNNTLTNSSLVLVTNTGGIGGGGLIGSPVIVSNTALASAHLRIGSSPMNVIGSLTVSNLTLGSGSELDVKVGTSSSDLLVVQGNLNIDPAAVLNVLPMQQLTPGSYTIITYSGTLTGTFNPAIGSLSRYGYSIDYSTPNQIKLVVSGSNASLTWRGWTNTTWDVVTTSNWLNGAAAAQFNEGDAVTFDDSATNFSVSVVTTVYPASMTFNNNSNYSISGTGSGRISGGTSVTKNGNGTLTLLAGVGLANDYTGPVQINGGILKMNGGLALGSTNGATTVASGATLDINGQGMGSEPLFLTGTGFGGTNGALMNSSGSSPGQSGGPRVITLQGDTTINSIGSRFDIGNNALGAGGGSFTGNGFNLTKIGAPDIWLHEVGDIGVGNIFINQGVLGFQYTIGLGDPTKTINVAPGASLSLFQTVNVLTKNVVLTNGSTLNSLGNAGSSNVLAGAITLYGTNTVNCAGSPLDLPGIITGAGAITKVGANVLRLESANNYSGVTLINAGKIVLGPSGSMASSTLINMAANTSIDASPATAGLSLASGQTLSGFGSLAGTVTVGAGSTLSLGNSTTPFTMIFSNALTLNGGTCVIKLSGDSSTVGGGVNDLLQVNGNLTLSGTTTIQIAPTAALDAGGNPYTIAQYSGTLSGSAANLHVVSSNPRYSFTVDTSSPGAIKVQVNGNSAPLIWRGGKPPTPDNWDHTATNWFNLSSSQFDQSFNGDLAIFDDTGVSNIVTVVGTNNSGTVIMSNSTVNYTLVGGGLLTGPVDMEGTGSLIISMSNAPLFTGITNNSGMLVFNYPVVGSTNKLLAPFSDSGFGLNPGQGGTLIQGGSNILVLNADNTLFDGVIAVTNGILQYTNAVCLGDPATPLFATNGGTLDLNHIATGPKNIQISGAGYNGMGAAFNSGGGLGNAGINNLTLLGDTTIGGSNRWDIINGTFAGNGFSLTEAGGTTLCIDDGSIGVGDIHILAGRFGFQGGVDMGDPTKTCTVEAGATLTLFNATNSASAHNGENKILVLKGNAVLDSGGGSNNFEGPIFLSGTNLIGTRNTMHVWNAIMDTNGPGGILFTNDAVGNSSGDLYLDGANTYSGPTIIFVRTIFVGASSSLGSSSLVLVNNPGKLDVTALSSLSLGSGQILQGNGTVNANSVVIGSGARLVPGTGGNNTGTLTLNGNLTLQLGSTNAVNVNKTASIANSKVSGLTNVVIGGDLVLNLIGNPLAGGDAITLFTASGTYSGGFNTISPTTPGTGLAWDTSSLLNDGKLRVLATVNPNSTNMAFNVSAGSLNITWPSDHTGWRLQSQTNSLTGTWYDVPGSTSTNSASIPVDPTQNAVFYRMVYP